MSETPVFDGFWNGFLDPDGGTPTPLDQTPEYVNFVTLAFGLTAPDSGFSTDYVCRQYPADQIIPWARTLQANGQKVLMSIIDTSENHWSRVDIPKFVAAASEVIIGEWGLDGVDIDGESGEASAENFIQLIQEFRQSMGPLGSGRYVTFDSYLFNADTIQILEATKDDLDWVSLMAYFATYDSMITLFEEYSGIVGPQKVTIGVKPGRGGRDQSTPLDEVICLAQYQPAVGEKKRGMMLYSLTRDIPFYTGCADWTWTEAIHENLAE
ncbi:MAG: glycosyl hydrolase family 18 protein [Proteobacteria bacterium]|nr:glycosyl hydrolase family 18 protein [Pseudomonadota bacterium]